MSESLHLWTNTSGNVLIRRRFSRTYPQAITVVVFDLNAPKGARHTGKVTCPSARFPDVTMLRDSWHIPVQLAANMTGGFYGNVAA